MSDVKTRDGEFSISEDELRVVSAEELEELVDDVLEEKKPTLTKKEREVLIQKVISKADRNAHYVRTRSARKLRAEKKVRQERVAEVAGSLALSVGSSAAAGLVAAVAMPSAPFIAMAGAVAGLVGAWIVSKHDADAKRNENKGRG